MGDVDHVLRSQVSEMQRMMVNLDRGVSTVSQQVIVVGQEQKETRGELATLRAEFLKFVRQAELTANIQRAETRLGALQDQLEHQFGHHKVVRRTAVGVLQAFDIGLVSEETIKNIGEQLMVQTPRYWLAPVIVALAAWCGDDEELCRKAVEEAFRRSPSRTSLFMALVLRRQGRGPGAVRWLRHYLQAQDPNALGRDFAVILEAISQGAFGPAGLELAQGFLDRWRSQLLTDDSVTDAQVNRWRVEVSSHVPPPPAAPRFARLATVSPQYVQLDRVLAAAEAHTRVLAKYEAMMAEEIPPADRLEDAVDDILDRLVSEYDAEELPLRRELAFNEAVIAHHGDVEVSQRALAADAAALETTLDYLTIQTTSALNPTAIGVSRSTQRFAVASCHEWFARAHALFTRDYRAAVPPDVQAAFESSHNVVAKQFQLPRWVGSFRTPLDALEKSLSEHWEPHINTFVDGLAFDRRKWLWPVVSTLGALVVLVACMGWPGVFVALLGGGIWALVLHNQAQAAERRQEEAQALLDRARHDSITQLRAARAELTDWEHAYLAADAEEPATRHMIAGLATAAHAATPYERRTVAAHLDRQELT